MLSFFSSFIIWIIESHGWEMPTSSLGSVLSLCTEEIEAQCWVDSGFSSVIQWQEWGRTAGMQWKIGYGLKLSRIPIFISHVSINKCLSPLRLNSANINGDKIMHLSECLEDFVLGLLLDLKTGHASSKARGTHVTHHWMLNVSLGVALTILLLQTKKPRLQS